MKEFCIYQMKFPAFDLSRLQTLEMIHLPASPTCKCLLNYQDSCQNLAASEANDGNAEKMIQLDPPEIEGELLSMQNVTPETTR